MPERCSDPSCEQHWPQPPDAPDLLGALQASLEKSRARLCRCPEVKVGGTPTGTHNWSSNCPVHEQRQPA